MKYTQNYNLRKPEDTDPADIQDLNYNADVIDSKLKEIEDWEAAHLQASNPHGITPALIGAETPTGAQQKANQAETNAKSYADIVTNSALNSAKDYADGVLESANSHTDQVASDLSQKLNETRIKVLDVEQDVSNISKVLINLNPNQEAKQSVSGYGILSLPKNAANGQVSVTVKGNTETDEEGNTKSTIGAVRIKSVGKNLFDKNRASKGFSLNPSTGLPQLPDRPAFYSDFIRVNSNEPYYISGFLNKGYSFVAYYDKDKRFIRRSSASVRDRMLIYSDLPDNAKYIRITVYDNEGAPATWEDIDDVLNNLQVERGNVPTAYETYQESNAYVIAKNEQGNVLELRSLPNGVKDEVNVAERRVIKRTKKIIFDGSENWFGFTATYADSNGFYRMQINGWVTQNKAVTGFDTGLAWNDLATFRIVPRIAAGGLPNSIGFHENGNLYLSLPRDYIDANYSPSIEGMRQYLSDHPITLIYQLTQEQVIPVQVSGALVGFPSGTVYWEQIVPDAGVYTDKITILHQDAPIKRLDKLSKVDFMTGVETELDISQAEIAEDKLSFTHPDLSEGDIVFFEYEYDVESTEGEAEVEFYDSRYVVKDDVTGKFYKWNVKVSNGTPTIEVVEV